MKKILSILLSMLLVLSLVPCAMANSDVTVTLDGEKISSVKLVAEDNINKKEEKGFFKKLLEKIGL